MLCLEFLFKITSLKNTHFNDYFDFSFSTERICFILATWWAAGPQQNSSLFDPEIIFSYSSYISDLMPDLFYTDEIKPNRPEITKLLKKFYDSDWSRLQLIGQFFAKK